MIRQDLPSRRKEKVTDGTAIIECDNFDVHADDVIVPKENMFEDVEETGEEEDTGSDNEWHPESFSINDEERDNGDHEG